MEAKGLITEGESRFECYCTIANIFLSRFNIKFNKPKLKWVVSKSSMAGRACLGKLELKLNLSYLIHEGNNFYDTIGHEVAHFVVYQLNKEAKNHGDLFKFISEFIFKTDPSPYHDMNFNHRDILLAKLVLLKKELKNVEE